MKKLKLRNKPSFIKGSNDHEKNRRTTSEPAIKQIRLSESYSQLPSLVTKTNSNKSKSNNNILEFEDFFTTNWNNTPTKPQIQNENKQINKIAPEDIRIDIDSMQPHILLKGVIIVETPCGTQIHSFRNREQKFSKQRRHIKRSLH